MKVLHVIPSIGPRRGGPSVAIRSIASGLAQRGIETHVATTDDNGPALRLDVPLRRPIQEGGAIYWYFPRQTPVYLYSAPFTGWMWRHARDFSLIHIHALFSYCSTMAAYIASTVGVPYIIRPLGVLNRWGMEQRRPRLKRLSFRIIERRLLERAAFVHYTAEQEMIEAAHCGFAHRPIVIPNPVEASGANGARGGLRRNFPELRDRRIVLFLSRIDRKKGLDLLIPAFAGVLRDKPGAALVIAGDGNAALIRDVNMQCRSLGIADSVFWPGFLSGRAKASAFADADIFVLPSYSENLGIAPIEAMAAGVPVITTDRVGIHRQIAAANAGLIVPAETEPLRCALLRLLSDGNARTVLGRNGAELARAQFAPPVVLQKLIDLYTGLCPAGTESKKQ